MSNLIGECVSPPTPSSRVVFVFLDGVGIGPPGPPNPLDSAHLPILNAAVAGSLSRELPHGGQVVGLDAGLGVPGLAQSATGQTTLLTGVNAPALLGRHWMGFPTRRLRDILGERSLLRVVAGAGRRATFANAYRPEFFRVPFESIVRRLSVTTIATRAAGVPFRTIDDLSAGRAVYHDVTGEALASLGHPVAPMSPGQAGRVLGRIAADHDFTLYEHFLTDRAGHAQDATLARTMLGRIDALLSALLSSLDLSCTTVLVTSDHGNVEDLSCPTHTANPVPAFLWGQHASALARRLHSILDVYPALLSLLVPAAPEGKRGETLEREAL